MFIIISNFIKKAQLFYLYHKLIEIMIEIMIWFMGKIIIGIMSKNIIGIMSKNMSEIIIF